MKLNFLLLSVLCLDIASHEAPKNDEEKQFYVDNFIEISNVRSQYINTYLADFAVPAFRYSIKNNGTETISTLWVNVYFLDKMPSEINPSSISLIFIFSLIISAMASYFPARLIVKMNTIQALKYE